MKQALLKIIALVLIAANIFVALFFSTDTAFAAINKQINYQGRLTTSANSAVSNANYSIRFKLYSAPTGGSPLWTEAWCYSPDGGTTCNGSGTDNRVAITDGLFSVLLGSTTALTGVDFNQTLYLGVEIGGSSASASWDGEMTPRKKLGAVPAAIYSENAGTVGGVASSSFFRSDAVNSTSTASTFMSVVQAGAGKIAEFFSGTVSSVLSLLSNGSVGVGTTTPGSTFAIQGTSSAPTRSLLTIASSTGTEFFTVLPTGNIGMGTTSPLGTLSIKGAGVGNGVNFTTTNSSNARLFTILDNGNVGIGTSTPNSILEIVRANDSGSIFRIGSSGGSSAHFDFVRNSGTGALSIQGGQVGNNNIILAPTSGSVGIGTTTPVYPLTVKVNGSGQGFFIDSGTTGEYTDFVSGGVEKGIRGNGAVPFVVANTGDIFLRSGGINRLHIASTTGNVGIGTTTPGSKLTVSGTLLSTGNGILNNAFLGDVGHGVDYAAFGHSSLANTSSYSLLADKFGGTYINSSNNLPIYFRQDNSDIMTLTASGRLGIGSSTPAFKLSINGDVNAGFITGTSTTATSTFFAASTTNFAINGRLSDALNFGGTLGMVLQTSGTSTKWVATSTLGISGGSGNSAFTIGNGSIYNATSTDAVMVGTSTATTTSIRFHVERTGIATSTTVASSVGIFLGNSTPATATQNQNSPCLALAGQSWAASVSESHETKWLMCVDAFSGGLNGTNTLVFKSTIGLAQPQPRIFMTSGGKFGIATSTPTEALSVAGNALVNGVVTASTFNGISTTATSTFFAASATNIAINGTLFDTTNSAGTIGMVLQTSGTSTKWVATSTLGITGGGSGNAAFTIGNGFIYNATTTDRVAIGSTTAIATLNVRGTSGTNPFIVASSTGAQLLTLLQNGNFGIGTSTPSEKFSVAGNALIDGIVTASTFRATSTTASSFVNASSTNLGVSGNAYFGAGSGIWNSSGNVGINTVSPNSLTRLDIAGGDNENLSGGTAQIALQFATGNYRHFIKSAHSNTAALNKIIFAVSNGTSTSTPTTGVVNAMALTGEGNVGIGTISPTRKLEVMGTGRFQDGPSPAAPTFNSPSIQGGSSAYLAGDNVSYRAYGYKVVGATTYYSQTYADTGSLPINTNGDVYAISINLPSGADGVRTFLNYNGGGYFDYRDGLSWIDDSTGWTPGLESTDAVPTAEPYYFLASYNDGAKNWSAYGDNAAYFGALSLGSTTPTSKLSVDGDMNLTGSFLANGNAGTLGMVLQTTGTSTRWVATSTLGFSSANYFTLGNGFVANATTTDAFRAAYFMGTSTTATSTFFAASTTNFAINGRLSDATNSAGTIGMVLQTTGTSTRWVATSTLGITGGGSGNDAFTIGNGFIYNATSTDLVAIGSTTAIATLNVRGSAAANPFIVASSTGAQLFNIMANGAVGIGSSTPSGTLSIRGAGSPIGSMPLLDIASSTGARLFVFDASGRLGIGTSTPLSKVSISEGTSATAFRIERAAGASSNASAFAIADGQGSEVFGASAWAGGGGIGANPGYGAFVVANNCTTTCRLGEISWINRNTSNRKGSIIFQTVGTAHDRSEIVIYTGGAGTSFVQSSVFDSVGQFGQGSTTPAAMIGITGRNASTTPHFIVASSTNVVEFIVTGQGLVGVGTTSPSASFTVRGTGANNPFLVASSTGAQYLSLLHNGRFGVGSSTPSQTFSVSGTVAFDGLTASAGDAVCIVTATKEITTNTGATTCAVSSQKYKHDIQDLNVGLNEVMKLRPVSYEYNGTNGRRVGFIAEEINQIDTRFVFNEKDGSPRGVRYEEITSLLTKAIQEQQKEIDALKVTISGGVTTAVINSFSSLGAEISNGFMKVVNLVADSVTTKRLKVEEGISVKDKATGSYYCIVVENGSMKSIPGECASTSVVATPPPSGGLPPDEIVISPDTSATSTDPGTETSTITVTSDSTIITTSGSSTEPTLSANPPVVEPTLPTEPTPPAEVTPPTMTNPEPTQ